MCWRACKHAVWCAQVSYCQGMAFVAGVILMYLPEEPAFSVLTRLMGPGGPDLRTLFLPGLLLLPLQSLTVFWLQVTHQMLTCTCVWPQRAGA